MIMNIHISLYIDIYIRTHTHSHTRTHARTHTHTHTPVCTYVFQVAKVSIAPRGNAGGLTVMAPDEDRLDSGLVSRHFLESQLMVALGGRVAEELVFGGQQITTGASNDLEKVAATARMMVTRFGLSEKLGHVTYADDQPRSQATCSLIDAEVEALVKTAHSRAKLLLSDNRSVLAAVAGLLLEQETVTAVELEQLMLQGNVVLPALRDPSLEGYDF